MSKPKANPDQFEFDGVFVFSQGKQNLTIREVAAGVGISERQVRDLLDTGVFVNASISDKPQTEVQRDHVRIARFSVVAWWRERQLEKGIALPYRDTPEIAWWRDELRKQKQKGQS